MATITSGPIRKGQNAMLSYTNNGNFHRHLLWVNEVSQTLGLSGQTAQSRLKRSFYPRANQLGTIDVNGQCGSQTEYQQLALFIRKHHRALMSAPDSDILTKLNSTNPAFSRLLRLQIYKEAISVRGFIERFEIKKRGLFDPAPKYSFSLTVVADPNTTNSFISYSLQKYFSPKVVEKDGKKDDGFNPIEWNDARFQRGSDDNTEGPPPEVE